MMMFFRKCIVSLCVLSMGLQPIAIYSSENISHYETMKSYIATAIEFSMATFAVLIGFAILYKLTCNEFVGSVEKLDTRGIACSYVGEEPKAIRQLIHQIKNAEEYKKKGVAMTKGILLHGDPGCGKTFLAKHIATQAKCPFFACSAAEFTKPFVGVGIGLIKKLFRDARDAAAKSPTKTAILFIDELDAIGNRSNNQSMSVGLMDEKNITTLLDEMDGLKQHLGINVVVIGATNYCNKIDAAITRSGRLDQKIRISLPTEGLRKQLFKQYLQDNVVIEQSFLDILAHISDGMSPADIQNICNQTKRNIVWSGRKDTSAKEGCKDTSAKDLMRKSFAEVFFRQKKEQRERLEMSKDNRRKYLTDIKINTISNLSFDSLIDCTNGMTPADMSDFFAHVSNHHKGAREGRVEFSHVVAVASCVIENKIKRAEVLEKINIASKIYGIKDDVIQKKFWNEAQRVDQVHDMYLLNVTNKQIIEACQEAIV